MAYHPFRHLGLKVLAIALATLLWLTVAGQHVVERTLRVPLENINMPPGLEIVGDVPAAVDVRLRGSSAILSRLEPGEVIAVLDMTTARTGSRLFHLRADEVKAPYGVDVVQVAPSTLSLEIEKSAIRTVPVVPALDGDPAPGYVVGRLTAEPATVDVMGPESRVRDSLGGDDGTCGDQRQPRPRSRRRHNWRRGISRASRSTTKRHRDRRSLAGTRRTGSVGRAHSLAQPRQWVSRDPHAYAGTRRHSRATRCVSQRPS